ncbi:MAG TPA: ribose-phosphate diphosphokinase [Solirubrobacteraceae bacterium]|nr:ribose-phosphate diphosphokinase [Solirubrobacteraceae bacterium]
MVVRVNDVVALPWRAARVCDARQEHAAIAPLVVVLPGCGRFVTAPFTRVAVGRFPNGELRVEVPQRIPGRCVVVGSISPPAGNLERLTLVVHTLRRAGARWVTALLPYLAYARQDRALRGEGLGLGWVGELLGASGIDEVVCVDVHGAKASEILGLPLSSLSPAGLLAGALPEAWRHDVTFVAPDEGAIGRCSALARAAGVDRPIVYARKRRVSSGVEHLGLVGSPGRRVVVVDDILDTGATLVSCCQALRMSGVRQLGVIATHGLFTGDRWRAVFSEGVQEMWVTDTVLSRRRPPQAHVVPVAPLLVPVLEGAIA